MIFNTNTSFAFKQHRFKQQGQAMVYVLVFMPMLIMSLLMLYNSGKLTDEKMKMQNAADATAYSISVLEARDLNFTSYTNRAMIANEIAIAQLVGLYSWFDQIESSMKFFNLYVIIPMDAIASSTSAASLGILAPIMATMVAVLKAVKAAVDSAIRVIKKVLKAVIKGVTIAMGVINTVYSTAQLVVHYATLYMTISVIEKIIPDNAPGAKLSDFGLFAVAAHVATYYANPLTDKTFVHRNGGFAPGVNNDTSEIGKTMRHQYAATVNGSRDDFSINRGGGFTAALIPFPEISFGINVNLGIAKVKGSFFFDLGVDLLKRGGTDLRFKESGKTENYSWTGVDLIGMDFWFKLMLKLKFKLCLPLVGCFSPFPSVSINLNPHLDIPFAIGTGMVSNAKGKMNYADMSGVDGKEYGGAPGDLKVTYNFPSPFPDFGVPGQMQSDPTTNIYTGHKGLPQYNSASDPAIMAELAKKNSKLEFLEDIGFFAPNLVIGLVKDKPDIRTADKIVDNKTTSQIHLENKLQDDEVAVIAKSQVYFSRPVDPLAGHFNRLDKKTEHGSTYNPFWQARLVKTEIPERVIALLFQQKQIWPISGVSLTLPFGMGTLDLNKMLRDINLI